MNVLVLGASGQLGSRLAHALVERGHRVTACMRRPPAVRNSAMSVLVHQPLDGPPATRMPVDVVVNCIGTLDDPSSYVRTHLELLHAWLPFLRRWGAYWIQLSALNARSDHPSAFLRTKGLAEEILATSYDRWAVLRPSIVCTPGTRLAANLAMLHRRVTRFTGVLPLISADTRLQPVWFEDLAETVLHLAEAGRPRVRLDVVGSRVYSLRDLALRAGRAMSGRNPWVWNLPRPLAAAAATVGGWVQPTLLRGELRILLREDNRADAAPLATLLGRPPLDAGPFFDDPVHYVGGATLSRHRPESLPPMHP